MMKKNITKNNNYVATSSDGVRICVGTFIHFLFFSSTPFGDIEDDIQGRIIEVKGHLCLGTKTKMDFTQKDYQHFGMMQNQTGIITESFLIILTSGHPSLY